MEGESTLRSRIRKRTDIDELTPELALVDPELARLARERLPDPEAPPYPVVARPEQRVAPPAERPRRRGRRQALVLVAGVLGSVALGAGAGLLLRDRPIDVRSGTAGTQSSGTQASLPEAGAPEATVAAPSSCASRKSACADPRRAKVPKGVRFAAATAGFSHQASSSFGWVPVARAAHYHVAFFRGAAKIYEAWPKQPLLVLPRRWRFGGRSHALSAGVYRWVVRPGFGARRSGRYGRPVVDASLTVR